MVPKLCATRLFGPFVGRMLSRNFKHRISIMRRRMFAVAIALVIGWPIAAQSDPVVKSTSSITIGESLLIHSDVLGEDRRINAFVPPGHGTVDAAPLPVLYMPDGGLREDFQHVAGLVQVSVGNETMRPFLLVGVENTERRRDLTGPTSSDEDKKIAPHVGGSEVFRRFIRSELMPLITQRYRTTNETAIVGESLAGLFIVETLLREPDLFDSYLAFDPSLWWNDKALVLAAEARLPNEVLAGKSLFIATSSQAEIAKDGERFCKALANAHVDRFRWSCQSMPEETHGTIYHPAALRAFRALLGPAPATKRD